MQVLTQEQIAEKLRARGTNLCRWARENGWGYSTVFNTVVRWAGRTDRTPHGGFARQIMKELYTYLAD